jgi:hypothetical protein
MLIKCCLFLFFQPVTEASYANIPIVAYCNIDSPTKVTKIITNRYYGCRIVRWNFSF